MDRLSSSASTVPSIDDYFEHNVWNPLLELLFLEHATGIIVSYLVEIDLAKIALSSNKGTGGMESCVFCLSRKE